MSDVCFIIPPSAFLLDERVFVSLGALKVAAAHRARGHSVEVLDLSGVANYEEAAAAHCNATNARAFAITATTPQMPSVARIVGALQESAGWQRAPKLIVGGPHPTLAAAAAKREAKRGGPMGRASRALEQLRQMFDVVVAGDGEDAIEQALRLGHGLVDADDPKGPLFLTSKRLEETPWPARDLIDLDSYRYEIDGVRATSLVAQLGCPFGCSFCGGRASPMLRKIRTRSTENILAELEHLHTVHGYRGFMFYDDELNVNKSLVELMRGIAALAKSHGTTFHLRGFVKAELFTLEQAEAMRAAGFSEMLCGFESGHPRILENIQKKATVEDNDRAVSYARAAGLRVKALMSIGHAGESADTIEATRRWLLRTRPDSFDCTIITPYPGSPYYDDARLMPRDDPARTRSYPSLDHIPPFVGWALAPIASDDRGEPQRVWTYEAPGSGDRLHAFEIDYMAEADYYKGAPDGGYVSHVFTDHVSPNDLVRLRDRLEASVRAELGIAFNPSAAAIRFEHSMGQAGALPPSILRRSAP